MSTRRNTGSLVGGALLIGFGILALFGQLFRGFNFWSTFWPFIIIGIGLLFFVAMFAGGKSTAALAIPGSILTVIGLMMFAQNLTGYWESWSYSWTVILMGVGLGLYLMGLWSGDARSRQAGGRVLKVGVVLFILFSAFFEILFSSFRPLGGVRQIAFPAALILLGLYLVVSRSGLLPGRRAERLSEPAQPSEPSQPSQLQ